MSQILEKLWQQYTQQNPHIQAIHQLFIEQGEAPVNDHIALRTLNHPNINIHQLAKAFTPLGYEIKGDYHFEVKKLKAIHLEQRDNPLAPKIFISQLMTEYFSPFVQDTLTECIKHLPNTLINDPEALLLSGNCWQPIHHATYQALLKESEYAAWFYVFGFCANHFTVLINELEHFNEVTEVNTFLKAHHYQLNASGGEVKGTPKDYLEQSSTLAGKVEVNFSEGQYLIPCCYYEFAKRYPDPSGKLYTGFVTQSADKIFESTHQAQQ